MAILINWVNPNEITASESAVRIYRATSTFDENSLPPILATLAAGTTRYVDTSAANDVVYFYRVSYVNGAGQNSLSEILQVRAPAAGVASKGESLSYITSPKYFVQDFSKVALYDSGHADSIRGDVYSLRKVLAAMVIIEEKSDVLNSEAVTMTAADIATTAGEWLSGFQANDVFTWNDLIKLMLVPSKSDVAATVNRVLGTYLRTKYQVGENDDQSLGYFMTQAALRCGAVDALVLSNSANPPPANHTLSTAQQMFATARTFATVMALVKERYPVLVSIMKMSSVTITANRAGTPVALTFASMTINQHGADGKYEIGKTGDTTTTGHEMFVFVTPSGKRVSAVTLENATRLERWQNSAVIMAVLPNLKPEYRSTETANDPNASFLRMRVQGDAFADISPNGFAVSAIGSAVVQNSPFFKNKAIFCDTNAGILVNGTAPIGSGDFTIELFMRRTVTSEYSSNAEVINQWARVSGGRSWSIDVGSGNQITFWYSTDGSNSTSIITTLPKNFSQKMAPLHYVVQRRNGVIRIYMYGVVVATVTVAAAFFNTASKIVIGCNATTINGTTYQNFLPNTEIHEASVYVGKAVYPDEGFTTPYRWKRWD